MNYEGGVKGFWSFFSIIVYYRVLSRRGVNGIWEFGTRGREGVRAGQVTNVNSVRMHMDFGGSAKFGYLEIRIPFRSPGFSTRCGLGAVGTRFTGMIAE